jgi:alkylhydroperoxidase/carboxymuconolactone decarboxylase family protein YurZ
MPPSKSNVEFFAAYENPIVAQASCNENPSSFEAVADFWSAPFHNRYLSDKMNELVCIALHASASTLHSNGIRFHIVRALQAGATKAEICEVLLAIVPLGVHSFGFGIPVLLDELRRCGRGDEAEFPQMKLEIQQIKDDFIRDRGYWTEQREMLARLAPDYFVSYMALSSAPSKSGILTPKERELVYIAIDCSITHMHEPGLRTHIRNALKHGASRDEILAVFQLVSTLGTNSYVAGTALMFGDTS